MNKMALKIAQDFIDMDPEMLQRLLEGFIIDTKDNWNYILPTDLYKLIKADHDLFLLDLRKSEDFNKGHIKGATNIFWLDIMKNLKNLPTDKKIILICYVGHTASQVLVILKLMGYDVIALKFGMGISPSKGIPVAGWLNYKYEVEK